jgi:hypothetical protein
MRGFLKIMEELGWPPVYLIPSKQYQQFAGEKMSRSTTWGYAAEEYPVITVLSGLRGKSRDNVIYHEIAHHLWPNKPHWWIDIFGEKMAGGGGRGHWAYTYGKTLDDLPDRETLVKMARKQSARLMKKYKVRHVKPR